MSREVKTMPITSLDAYKALTPEQLSKDYGKILNALQVLREANYETIAHYIMWKDINKCSRRLSEMEAAQLIYKPGTKSLTTRNRQSFNWKIVESNEQSALPEKLLSGKSIVDFSRELIQKELF